MVNHRQAVKHVTRHVTRHITKHVSTTHVHKKTYGHGYRHGNTHRYTHQHGHSTVSTRHTQSKHVKVVNIYNHFRKIGVRVLDHGIVYHKLCEYFCLSWLIESWIPYRLVTSQLHTLYFKHILMFNKKQLDRTQVSQLSNVFSNNYTLIC